MQEQEAALNSLIVEAERSLADAESERSVLEADLHDQEARLTSEFAAREAELTEERAAAVDLLTELQSQQEQEQLVLDQILAFYAGIQSDLASGDLDGALESTSALRSYLSEGSVAELPTVQRRRRVELFLVESLEARVAAERAAASPDTVALAESAAIIAQVTELVTAADSAYGAAEFENAKTLYLAALSEIPAVRVGYDRLVELEEQAGQADSDRVASLVQRGNDLYRAGAFQDAAAVYGEALATLPSSDAGLLSRVLDAGYQLQRASDLTALRTVQAELEAAHSRLVDQQTLLDQQETQLAESDNTTVALQSQVAALQSQLDAAPAEPVSDSRQEERIAALESELSDTNEAIAGREEEIVALRLSITDLDTLLAESRAAADQLQQETESFGVYAGFYREQQDLADEIIRYQERFVTSDAGDSTSVSALELLETKLVILRIIGSESIQAQYPDLTDQLNAYLDALVAEQRGDATEKTLAGVNVVLDALLDGSAGDQAIRADQVPPALADTDGEIGKFFGLLGRLAGPE